jgi:hypothetical protein
MCATLNLGDRQWGLGVAGMASEGDIPLPALRLSPEPSCACRITGVDTLIGGRDITPAADPRAGGSSMPTPPPKLDQQLRTHEILCFELSMCSADVIRLCDQWNGTGLVLDRTRDYGREK